LSDEINSITCASSWELYIRILGFSKLASEHNPMTEQLEQVQACVLDKEERKFKDRVGNTLVT